MKPLYILFFLFLFYFNLLPQELHTYGPVKEQDWYTYAYNTLAGGGPHYIGDNVGGGVSVNYICFVKWLWNESDIPNEATLESINIKFKTVTKNNTQRDFHFTLHWIEENWVNSNDLDTIAHDVYYTDNRLVYEDNQGSNSSGYVTYEKTITSGDFFEDIQEAITNANHFMALAIRSESDGMPYWVIYPYDGQSSTTLPSIDITFHYTTSNQTFVFYNKFGSNLNSGHLVLNNDYEHPFASGTPQYPPWGENTVRTNELPFDYNWNQTGQTQKHKYWSASNQDDKYLLNNDFKSKPSTPHTQYANFLPTAPVTISNRLEGIDIYDEDIYFGDPFYYYENNNIWHQSDEPYPHSSPFYINNNSQNSYGGVFLNQSGPPSWIPPYYSIQAQESFPIIFGEPIGTRNFYFKGWEGTDVNYQYSNNTQTGVVFTESNANAYADYKGQGLSGDQNTYIKGGQRKIVRTSYPSSTLHRVYQDMGYVWYETSTDNGQNWNLWNDGQPLGFGGGRNPSIDWAYMNSTSTLYVVVVFQRPYPAPGHGYNIVLNLFGQQSWDDNMGSYELLKDTVIYSNFTSSTFDANPVVAITPNSDNLVARMDIVWQTSGGLYLYGAYIDADPNHNPLILTAVIPELIPNTNENSINPSIGVTKLNYNGTFGLAWEENNTIKYRTINGSNFGIINTISENDGYTYNSNPSLVVLSDNYARVCWRASRYVSQIDPTTKKDNSYWDTRTVFRGVNYNHFWHFGQDVGNPNINMSDPENYYAIVWNQDENSTYFTDNNLGTPKVIDNFPGSRVQVSNGPTKNQMYADVLNMQTTPYYFETTNSLGNYYTVNKAANYTFSSGREGVIAKDTAQFYFALGDIKVDDNSINFISIPDSVEFNTGEILNEYLVSEPFQLNDNSTFLYSIQYGITDSGAASNLLSNSNRYIGFKLQLVDAQTSEILGTYDEVIYDQSNIYQYNNLSYQVNTAGIGTTNVYLRLVTGNNFDPGYSLGEIYSAGDVLQKTSVITANYDGLKSVDTYDLSQNYPNPFNPATTINYQIPQMGYVTLKVYDILGKEVATLVHESKNQGRYSINFDASRLASGVYIYQLRINDYVCSKKMLLIK